MKTTILLDEDIYEKLVQRAIKEYGSAKNMSKLINKLLREKMRPKHSMFGTIEPFDYSDMRDKSDRYD